MEDLNWRNIAQRIKEQRKKNKITIERLSEIIGVSTSFIGHVERGDSGISVDNLYKLSRVFGVSVDYLLTGDNEEKFDYTDSKFNNLTTTMYDCTDCEIDFFIDLSNFLRNRVNIK